MGARELVERLIELRGGDHGELADMYASDAVVARQHGVARGPAEIKLFFDGYHAAHGRFDLVSLDSVTSVEDLILFEAVVETELGTLQIADVLVLDDTGSIRRHIIGQRGYWGK